MTTSHGTLVLMGSGETTPTMVTIHQALLDRLRSDRSGTTVRASLLDTPYGFQENAAEITAKALQYFQHNVGQAVNHIAAADIAGGGGLAVEAALDAVRRSDWVFAGPGSPTYAIRQWTAAPFVDALAEVCDRGGTVVLASAAAVTAGRRSIPVYEIYKAGEPPAWCEGLDLVNRLVGWSCVVIPHYDNAEGGTHDTRFCYLGQRRLTRMEQDLPAGTWVLGVDEHTACIIDLAANTVRVEGRGGVHIRAGGRERLVLTGGSTTPVAEILAAAEGRHPDRGAIDGDPDATGSPVPRAAAPSTDVMAESLAHLKDTFDRALAAQDAPAATAAALDTEQLIRDWSADTEQNGARDTAVAQLRAMITRLGDLAGAGMHDHTELVRPHIETLLHVREHARARRAFEVADHIRGHMDADGVRVRDTREGTAWEWDDPAADPNG